jgi:hypothetical protein
VRHTDKEYPAAFSPRRKASSLEPPHAETDPGFAGFFDRILPRQADIGKQVIVEFKKLSSLVASLANAAYLGQP